MLYPLDKLTPLPFPSNNIFSKNYFDINIMTQPFLFVANIRFILPTISKCRVQYCQSLAQSLTVQYCQSLSQYCQSFGLLLFSAWNNYIQIFCGANTVVNRLQYCQSLAQSGISPNSPHFPSNSILHDWNSTLITQWTLTSSSLQPLATTILLSVCIWPL